MRVIHDKDNIQFVATDYTIFPRDIQVHTGLWKSFNKPSAHRLMLTLTNAQALAVLAFLGAFIAFTQTRCWVIARYLLIHWLYPFYLEDLENPRSLWHLSQPTAIRGLMRQRRQSNSDTMTTVSRWFGISSLFNLIAFVVAGALIPYYLTGSGTTPLVQPSKYSVGQLSISPERIDEFYRTCWFNITGFDDKCGQWIPFLRTRPQLLILRNQTCPFPGHVCTPSTAAVQVEHTDLLPVDFGINTEPRFGVSHRVTCSPIQLEFFLNPDQHYQGIPNSSLLWFGADPPPLHDTTWVQASHGRFLRTQNGPNRFSKEMSGRSRLDPFAGNRDDISGLEIYPDLNRSWDLSIIDRRRKMHLHPHLRKFDGEVFVGIFGAGDSIYGHSINDPLYSAHRQQLTKYNPSMGTNPSLLGLNDSDFKETYDIRRAYIPDREATGLGCVEQFQVCSKNSSRLCSKWFAGNDADELGKTDTLLPYIKGDNFYSIAKVIIMSKSLPWYLTSREGTHKLISTWKKNWAGELMIDSDDHWVLEVLAWMEISLLRTRADFLESPKVAVARRLFYNNDYINIDFIGFTVTIFALFLVGGISYAERAQQYLRLAKLEIMTRVMSIERAVGKGIDSVLKLFKKIFAGVQTGKLSKLSSFWPRIKPKARC
ncbi:hypothetical protein B0O99DRAFT_644534 [Bisporella sp. PMI_857]|nr:hypothetical protein B0O99DRAFT_644534 [Bisporella sp. PMI_857]